MKKDKRSRCKERVEARERKTLEKREMEKQKKEVCWLRCKMDNSMTFQRR